MTGMTEEEARKQIKCAECGRFISYEDKKAKVYFEPDSDRGPEVVGWTCGKCVSKRSPQ